MSDNKQKAGERLMQRKRESIKRQQEKASTAYHDIAHCLAYNKKFKGSRGYGMFMAINRKDIEKRHKWEVQYDSPANNTTVVFYGTQLLNYNCMRVLQGLVAIASNPEYGQMVTPKQQLELDLAPIIHAGSDSRLYRHAFNVNFTVSQLLNVIGLSDGGNNFDKLIEHIERLSDVKVKIIVTNPDDPEDVKLTVQHLMSGYSFDKKQRMGSVYLNCRLASAVFAGDKFDAQKQYALLPMDEVRQIKNAVTGLVHQRLVALINPDTSKDISVSTMVERIYLPDDTLTTRAQNKRASEVKAAFLELEKLGWTVQLKRGDVYRITRPAIHLDDLQDD